jgi:hypothetical protein
VSDVPVHIDILLPEIFPTTEIISSFPPVTRICDETKDVINKLPGDKIPVLVGGRG